MVVGSGLEHVLRQLQLERARRQSRDLERLLHVIDERALEQLLRRNVDGDHARDQPWSAPRRDSRCRTTQHPLGELVHQGRSSRRYG